MGQSADASPVGFLCLQIHGGANQGIERAFDAGNEYSDYPMASQFAAASNSVRVWAVWKTTK
jgi:hypothetical protein